MSTKDTLNPNTTSEQKETHDLHVKRIPKAIWSRARTNAIQSGMTYRDYVIRILAMSQPLDANGNAR